MDTEHYTLPEDLLLLGLNDENGSLEASQTGLSYALGGAFMLELISSGALECGPEGAITATRSAVADPLLNGVFQIIVGAKRADDLKGWIKHIGWKYDLCAQIQERLIGRGVLRMEKKKLLWVFPAEDSSHENNLRFQLREDLVNGATPTERQVLLISLLNAASMVDMLVTKQERKGARARAKSISEGQVVGDAVNRAVQEALLAVNAAVVAAIISSTVVTS